MTVTRMSDQTRRQAHSVCPDLIQKQVALPTHQGDQGNYGMKDGTVI